MFGTVSDVRLTHFSGFPQYHRIRHYSLASTFLPSYLSRTYTIFSILSLFLKTKKVAYEITLLSVCLFVPPNVTRQRLFKRSHGNQYTRNNRRIVGRGVFYAVRVVSDTLYVVKRT
jgi:hypothetical protein